MLSWGKIVDEALKSCKTPKPVGTVDNPIDFSTNNFTVTPGEFPVLGLIPRTTKKRTV